MHTRLTCKNRTLYVELVESKSINAISNGGAREKVGELYKRNYLILLYTYKFGNIPSRTKIQIAGRTNSRKYSENEKSYCLLRRLLIRTLQETRSVTTTKHFGFVHLYNTDFKLFWITEHLQFAAD